MNVNSKLLSVIILLLCCRFTAAQSDYTFRNQQVKDIRYEIFVFINEIRDTMVRKTYVLVNPSGDTLFLYQEIPFEIKNGQYHLPDNPDTASPPANFQKDSCYHLYFNKNDDHYSNNELSHRNLNFSFKKKGKIVLESSFSNGLVFIYSNVVSYNPASWRSDYEAALDTLISLLKTNNKDAFAKAVHAVENTFTDVQTGYPAFQNKISSMATLVKGLSAVNRLPNYHLPDSNNVNLSVALFHFITDTTRVIVNRDTLQHHPFRYNFTDFSGDKDWTNMFVMKLMATKKGNCHSLPYLYKLLANEMGITSWLSLAPNHTYIKLRDMKNGWVNMELTSATFPTDAWVMGSGYISNDAVISGIYMDTLSRHQEIALCMLDLAKGYEHKTHIYTDGFILRCCDSSLTWYPNNIQALLLKAETLRRNYSSLKDKNTVTAKANYTALENLYGQLVSLGYREMPENMYLSWLKTARKESRRYQ